MDTNLAHTRLKTDNKTFCLPKDTGTQNPLASAGPPRNHTCAASGEQDQGNGFAPSQSQAQSKVLTTKWRISTDGAAELNCWPCEFLSSFATLQSASLTVQGSPRWCLKPSHPDKRPLRTVVHPPLSIGFPFRPLSPPVRLLTTWKTF